MRLFVIVIIFINQTFASVSAPDPSRYLLEPDTITTSEVNYINFHKITTEIYSLYIKQGIENNRHLVINLDWNSPYFTAWAHKEDSKHYSLNFWGGIARIPGMLEETWDFIVCHELGHILGGEPRHKIASLTWASAEGQSDHFAITKCLPRYYQEFNKTDFDSTLSLPIELDRCINSHSKIEAQNICLKILRAGRGLANILKYLNLSKTLVNYEHISGPAQETLYNSYPSAQCRIDIFYQQSSCQRKKECSRNDCWYTNNKSSYK
jgi:hypothetical protein